MNSVSWYVDGENLIINLIEYTNDALFVQFYDATGKLVSKTSASNYGGQLIVSINDLSKGNYIVSLSDGVTISSSFKIVK